ncbi:hypothetical protein RCL1_008763 [Eukaryota sp. TZLM3-RCL]
MTNIFCVVSLLLLISTVLSQPLYFVTSLQITSCGFKAALSLSEPALVHNEPLIPALYAELSCLANPNDLRFTITDPAFPRFRVSDVVLPYSPSSSTSLRIIPPTLHKPLSFQIFRKDVEVFSFNSTLLYTDHYVEFIGNLASDLNIYGLGYRRHNFLLSRNEKYGFWNRDDPGMPVDKPAYSTHPLMISANPNKGTTGLFFLNSNAMEIELTTNSFIFRSSGGIIDLFIYSGPNGDDVVKSHQVIVGKPVAIPMYSLGFMQSRWGWKTLNTVKDVLNQFTRDRIPLDVLFFDIDYMKEFKDFTLDPVNYPIDQMQDFIAELANKGVAITPIIDPGLPEDPEYFGYTELIKSKAYLYEYKENSIQPERGVVWPSRARPDLKCIFPDFSNPNISKYWAQMLADFHSLLMKKVINSKAKLSLWNDMNEVASFEYYDFPEMNFNYNNPPWKPFFLGSDPLNWKTLNNGARSFAGRFYDTHNLYSFYQSKVTRGIVDSIYRKKTMLITRSSFAGSGRYTSTWLGDNTSSFEDLAYSIPGILSYNLFGIPLTGPDVGGFLGHLEPNLMEELVSRWSFAGIFSPFFRNHNCEGNPEQHPSVFPFTRKFMKNIIAERYKLVLYMYSLFIETSLQGGAVIRPLWFDFPFDSFTYSYEGVYLIGDSILASPVLRQGVSYHEVYLPCSANWYDWFTGIPEKSGFINKEAPWDKTFAYQKGGSIIFSLIPQIGENLESNIQNGDVEVRVAIDKNGNAKGKFFIDDGITLNTTPFVVHANVNINKLLVYSTKGTEFENNFVLRSIRISGVFQVSKVFVNGQKSLDWTVKDGVLFVSCLVGLFEDLEVDWWSI